MANNTEQRSYDTGASEGAQSNFEQVASRLESLISQRDTDVRNAMAQYQADGVSDEYQAKEPRWHTAADGVRNIITTIRTSLQTTDDSAQGALQSARQSVEAIG